MILGTYDVVVIGAGHAGIEAAVRPQDWVVKPPYSPLHWTV